MVVFGAIVKKPLEPFPLTRPRQRRPPLPPSQRVFEKFYLGVSRLSMRRMAARSMKASEVWTFNSWSLLKRRFLREPRKRALHDPSQAHHLEGALPAFGDVQSPNP